MKAWLHVVSVGARVEENYAEPDFTDSVNINFVPAADSAVEARLIKTGGNYPKVLFFIARLSPRETQERRKAFWIASSQ